MTGAVQTFSDPLLYQKVFHATDVELLPTARGEFSAKLTQIRLNKIWMRVPRVTPAPYSALSKIKAITAEADRLQNMSPPPAKPIGSFMRSSRHWVIQSIGRSARSTHSRAWRRAKLSAACSTIPYPPNLAAPDRRSPALLRCPRLHRNAENVQPDALMQQTSRYSPR